MNGHERRFGRKKPQDGAILPAYTGAGAKLSTELGKHSGQDKLFPGCTMAGVELSMLIGKQEGSKRIRPGNTEGRAKLTSAIGSTNKRSED